MMSFLEVICPHCGTRGHIVLPPLATLVAGPCPECHELVAVFCGRALPLEKDIMLRGTSKEKHQHLVSVLSSFLDEFVGELLARADAGPQEHSPAEHDGNDMTEAGDMPDPTDGPKSSRLITREEIDRFIRLELPRLDNQDYFKAIFS